MRIIAITGNTGTGKTTFLNILRGQGYGTVNCDRIVHKMLKSEDRKTISQKFFTDPGFKEAHEKRIRPKIYIETMKNIIYLLLAGHGVIFVEIPLLFELNLHRYFYTIVIACDEELQIERGRTLKYLKERLALQLPIEKKIELAQEVIHNNGDIGDLIERARDLDLRGSSIYCCLLIISTVIFLIVCE
ncbi:dephospho-CoA kinase-like protein [Encephalitozoon intestinalis ATCC 50506]|uniref:Dephospho-CoA kinase-like protein n=1 Tax=Encephalitozoon intestinalis (strain ATCC 50506) TaxID=876142 RepID=E0SA89_ENCIT|nr:dephospho-CoA kinase-like protein [Encephalitozoon intestinalis ATCC 50506]ADM12514.1 dephospho-CoA kinase-like protein [Encephalitozoon intestinalis ATCC 50506]UTX46367.1 bifunctional coenzyme A synthase [Encephalitozoon intestinalis]